jgi:hypothetical protein
MRYILIFLAFVGLVMGAASARAEPDWTFDPVGDIDFTDSWHATFGLNSITGNNSVEWVQGKLEYDTFKATAIDSFTGSQKDSWAQVIEAGGGTTFAASGKKVTDPDKLGFSLHGNSSPSGDPPTVSAILYLQAYDLDKQPGQQRVGNEVFYVKSWKTESGEYKYTFKKSDSLDEWGQNDPIAEPFSMAFLGSAFLGVIGARRWSRRKEGSTRR